MKYILLIAISFLFIGCKAQFKDISHQAGYNSLVNKTYYLMEEMYILGVNLPPGYGQNIDVYKVGPIYPTWTGRELISREILPIGTALTIKSIETCKNCLDNRIEIILSIPSNSNLSHLNLVNAPIKMNIKYISMLSEEM